MRKKLYYFHYVVNKTGRLIFFSHPTMPGPARVLMVRRQRREQDDYRPQMPAAAVTLHHHLSHSETDSFLGRGHVKKHRRMTLWAAS